MGGLLTLLTGLPLEDIEAAILDPTNLGKEAKVVENILAVAVPGLGGEVGSTLVALFVVWVQASGGGTIAPGVGVEANEDPVGRGGRRG